MNTRRYVGKVAVVTGASSGIGAATARRLAQEGATVVLTDVMDGSGSDAAAALVADGFAARYVHCDVTEPDDWATVRELVDREHGRLDLLHSNAFVDREAAIHELGSDEWNRVLAVSLTGAFHGVRAFLPMLQAATGAVVLTSSVHAIFGLPGHPAYAAAKGALCSLGDTRRPLRQTRRGCRRRRIPRLVRRVLRHWRHPHRRRRLECRQAVELRCTVQTAQWARSRSVRA
jgi:NAD(P)-dependent dehydrogenase (short-subunit alcohol dehydrogenase family)